MNATLAKLTRLSVDPAAADGPLLDAFLGGDQTAFAALVRRHAALVFATCRRVLRHHQDAEDAFQATFLVLARRAADVWPRDAVGSWLFGVAHRVALKARAVRGRRLLREQPLEDTASTNAAPPDFDLAEIVHRAILKLPEVYRVAVVACDLQGLSRKEAAERLGWSEGTLSGRLARARDLLASRLKRLGVALPAGGLIAVFTTTETVSASVLQNTIQTAAGSVAGVPAPVAVLTEGVVRSMALFKLKTMATAVLTACAIGVGVFAASGAGTGDGPGGQQPQSHPSGPLPSAAKFTQPPAKPPAKPASDLDPLQGTWRVTAIREGDKTTPTDPKEPWNIEVSGSTLKMPYKDASGGWKQREYRIAVDASKSPHTIDLIAPREPVGRGIYQFMGHVSTCALCHKNPFYNPTLLPEDDGLRGLCEPGEKAAKSHPGMMLTLSVDGKRPANLVEGDGMIFFTLTRAKSPEEQREALEKQRARLEEVLRLSQFKDRLEDKAKLEAQLNAVKAQLENVKARQAVAVAQVEAERARMQLELAQANVEKARAAVDDAKSNLKLAQERLAAAEKAAADAAKKPQPKEVAPKPNEFTIHIRSRLEPEKVVSASATDSPTVLAALLSVADRVTVKADAVTVWVVRDKTLVPVDVAAILKSTDAKANFPLKPGDQLFVEVKSAK